MALKGEYTVHQLQSWVVGRTWTYRTFPTISHWGTIFVSLEYEPQINNLHMLAALGLSALECLVSPLFYWKAAYKYYKQLSNNLCVHSFTPKDPDISDADPGALLETLKVNWGDFFGFLWQGKNNLSVLCSARCEKVEYTHFEYMCSLLCQDIDDMDADLLGIKKAPAQKLGKNMAKTRPLNEPASSAKKTSITERRKTPLFQDSSNTQICVKSYYSRNDLLVVPVLILNITTVYY